MSLIRTSHVHYIPVPVLMRTTTPAYSATSARSYQQLLTKLLRHGAIPQLRKILDKTPPADVSPALPLLLEGDRRKILALLIESGRSARVLLELDPTELETIIRELDDSVIVSVCASSAPDDSADLLDILDEDRRGAILAKLEPTRGAKLQSLLLHERETAGSIMNTEFLALDEEMTVGAAIEALRHYPRKDSFFYVYTVDASSQLVGVLSLRSLILAEPETKINTIMATNVIRTTVEAPTDEVAQLVSKYDLLSVPVVDLQNRLVGVVTVDDVLDVIQEEADEDLLHLAGVAISERVTSPALQSFRMRFPWLVVNLATAFIASGVVRLFEGTIERWVMLAAFMPIVAGMGGNAGTQTLTVFVRGLALGEVNIRSGFAPIRKELLVGLANGLCNGLLTGLIVGLWTGDWKLALILCGAMICNMIVAGAAGGLVPVGLKELGFDPAISSSIFVTMFTDVAGFFSFLGFATLVLKFWG